MSSINIDQVKTSLPPDVLSLPEQMAEKKAALPAKHFRQCSLILGASIGVGRALASQLASHGHDLVLTGTEQRDLLAIARDCEIRYGVHVKIFEIDLSEAHFAAAFHAERILSSFVHLNHIFVGSGSVDPKDIGLSDAKTMRSSHEVHFLNLALLLSELTKHADEIALKNVVVCSSVTAHSPQVKNISYAASKASLETFCEGLRRLLGSQKICVQTYVLGHVDTQLTYGQKLFLPTVTAQRVAQQMLKNLGRDIGQVYYPGYWRFVVLVLRMLPWRVQRILGVR